MRLIYMISSLKNITRGEVTASLQVLPSVTFYKDCRLSVLSSDSEPQISGGETAGERSAGEAAAAVGRAHDRRHSRERGWIHVGGPARLRPARGQDQKAAAAHARRKIRKPLHSGIFRRLYRLLEFQIAPPGKIESGFQTSSSLSYTPSPSSPSGGVYTIGGGSPLPHNGDGIFVLT